MQELEVKQENNMCKFKNKKGEEMKNNNENKINELKNLILKEKDEYSKPGKPANSKCYLCGRIIYSDTYYGHRLCTSKCEELFNLLNKEQRIEMSHELHSEREEQRKLQKKEFSDKQKNAYESGDYEISEFSQHMANKYKD